MRTNIDIDDQLMAHAMEAGGFKTKKDAVEEGLRLLARRKTYEGLRALRGQLIWDDTDAGWAKSAHEARGAVQEPKVKAYAPVKTSRKRRG